MQHNKAWTRKTSTKSLETHRKQEEHETLALGSATKRQLAYNAKRLQRLRNSRDVNETYATTSSTDRFQPSGQFYTRTPHCVCGQPPDENTWPKIVVKCAFTIHSGMLLAHIISKGGITIHPGKVQDIMDAKAPKNA